MAKLKAGCVPIRRKAGSTSNAWELLLVQSRWTPEVWLFPKGSVEDDETAKEAAVRETCEEGGVTGDLGPKLGMWTTDRGTKQKLKMWLLFVTTEFDSDSKQWKERKKRLRAWHTFEEARALLTSIPAETQRPELLEMLAAAEGITQGLSSSSSRSKLSNGRRSPGEEASSADNS